MVIVPYEKEEKFDFKQAIDLAKEQKKENLSIGIVIGPEGGFSQKEFDYFKSKNLPLISLGDLILKAETAVIVTLGDIVYEYQR